MTKPTRRHFLGSSTAAVAAIGVIAIQIAKPADLDPVFAAIEKHRAAYVFHGECVAKAGQLETLYFDARRDYAAKPEAVKQEAAKKLLEILQPTQPEATLAKARCLLDGSVFQQIENEHATERAEAERLQELGCDTAWTALRDMTDTVPTTAAGAAALVSYMLEHMERDGFDNLLSNGRDDTGPSLGERLLRSILASLAA